MNTNDLAELLKNQTSTDSTVYEILNDMVGGRKKLAGIETGVTIFGSAREARGSAHYNHAVRLGRLLAEHSLTVVTGGGPGIMEAANKGAHEAGGTSVGINIVLPHEQESNGYTTHSLQVAHFLSRKALFADLSRAYVIFPGGFGTLDELSEIITLMQTAKLEQCPVILFDKAYWNGFMEWVRDKMLTGGYIDKVDIHRLILMDDVDEIADFLGKCLR